MIVHAIIVEYQLKIINREGGQLKKYRDHHTLTLYFFKLLALSLPSEQSPVAR